MRQLPIRPTEFEEWRDSPVTQIVQKAFAKLAQEARDKWLSASWTQGNCDPLLLADLRARAEVAEDLCRVRYEDLERQLCETTDEQPSNQDQA